MRAMIIGAVLLAAAVAGFHNLISSSFAAAWDAKAAPFSERFAPALDQMKKPVGALMSTGNKRQVLVV
jgi:hypothetical protein